MTLPLSGLFSTSLFGGFSLASLNLDLRDTALIRQTSVRETVHNHNDIKVNVMVSLGPDLAASSDPGARPLAPIAQRAAESFQACQSNPSKAESPPPAPFNLATVFTFNDPRIFDVEQIKLGDIRLCILRNGPTPIKPDHYPELTVISTDLPPALLMPDDRWKRGRRKARHELPSKIFGRPVIAPDQRFLGKLETFDVSASLYDLPLDKPIVLAGQDFIFAAALFGSVTALVIRSHRGGRILPSDLLVCLKPAPHFQKELDS